MNVTVPGEVLVALMAIVERPLASAQIDGYTALIKARDALAAAGLDEKGQPVPKPKLTVNGHPVIVSGDPVFNDQVVLLWAQDEKTRVPLDYALKHFDPAEQAALRLALGVPEPEQLDPHSGPWSDERWPRCSICEKDCRHCDHVPGHTYPGHVVCFVTAVEEPVKPQACETCKYTKPECRTIVGLCTPNTRRSKWQSKELVQMCATCSHVVIVDCKRGCDSPVACMGFRRWEAAP